MSDTEQVHTEESKEEKKTESTPFTIDLEELQSKLKKSNVDELKVLSKAITTASDKASTVKDFESYFRPYQEKRTLLWNELGSVNTFDLPVNVNAGQMNKPASYSRTIQLYFNSASNEQMEEMDRLRSKATDLDRVERLSNLPIKELEAKGLKIPSNYLTVSSEGADKKEKLLILRIVTLCGVDEDTAKKIKVIADARSLLDILDSWEYRCRTGYPNSSGKDTQSTSVSGYQ